jgi:hypothetical protein
MDRALGISLHTWAKSNHVFYRGNSKSVFTHTHMHAHTRSTLYTALSALVSVSKQVPLVHSRDRIALAKWKTQSFFLSLAIKVRHLCSAQKGNSLLPNAVQFLSILRKRCERRAMAVWMSTAPSHSQQSHFREVVLHTWWTALSNRVSDPWMQALEYTSSYFSWEQWTGQTSYEDSFGIQEAEPTVGFKTPSSLNLSQSLPGGSHWVCLAHNGCWTDHSR